MIEHVNLPDTGAADTPSEQFQQVLYNARCDPVYGLMKTEFLRRTRLHGGYGLDRVLLAEMASRSVSEIHNTYSRTNSSSTSYCQTDRWNQR